ncbi:cysteine rich repeat-containing protein [Ancylobacter crimeensis]|nr:cysteine rich repeat-containing protein [Ancylobacter crimeensis]
MRGRIWLAGLLLAGLTTGASAQTMSYAEAGALIAKSCGKAITTYCGKVNIGSGKVLDCLEKNNAKVPPQCFTDLRAAIASIDKRSVARQDAFRLCRADAAQFCGSVQPGDANLLDCLLASRKVVNKACQQALLDAGWQ